MSKDDNELDLEWEEWDGKSPFWHHCIAGSLAGVGEHVLLYPMDTVKTHMQTYCDECPRRNRSSIRPTNATTTTTMWNTMTKIANNNHSHKTRPATTWIVPSHCAGNSSSSTSNTRYGRLWRGVQSMAVGCIPAHALYFACYEYVKGTNAAMAGALATVGHDAIMTPLDTVKQRMQLGHYHNELRVAFRTIITTEGWAPLYRSFPITLSTNVPYGMIMVSTNEYLRHQLQGKHTQKLDMTTTVLAGCGAGAVAAAFTTPLDCIKTRLQTQRGCIKEAAKYKNISQAFISIYTEEGWRGFIRGMSPRIISHTPAVAISWTTYEFAKSYLASYS